MISKTRYFIRPLALLVWAVLAASVMMGLASPAQAQVNFGAPTYFTAGAEPVDVAVGDFDGDGNPDLAVPNHASDNV